MPLNEKIIVNEVGNLLEKWVDLGVRSLTDPNQSLEWSDYPESFIVLKKILHSSSQEEDIASVLKEVVSGFAHSILVMLDGGSELADKPRIHLLDDHGGEIPNNLHELLYLRLLDPEGFRKQLGA